MEPIEFYFEKYHSDKGANGYSNVYNDVFSPLRDECINLLEIGIGTLNPTHSNMLFWKDKYVDYLPGASLRAFRDYFPKGAIIGIDIQPDCMITEPMIATYLVDSTDTIACDDIFYGRSRFDFIIDDGDHNYRSQIKTFENFFGKMYFGGVYLLEDLESPMELMNYFSQTRFNWELRDRMIIIRK